MQPKVILLFLSCGSPCANVCQRGAAVHTSTRSSVQILSDIRALRHENTRKCQRVDVALGRICLCRSVVIVFLLQAFPPKWWEDLEATYKQL